MNDEKLNRIYDRTSGKCHLCHKKLSFLNYGKRGSRGSWHVEHSVPRAKGGTDRLSNLYAACINCNLEKGIKSTRSIRSRNGVKRAPMSRVKIAEKREENSLAGFFTGVLLGAARAGAPGAVIGGVLGLLFGNALPVE